MTRFHAFSLALNWVVLVHKDLSVADHPVAVKQHQHWSEPQHFQRVDSKLVVESRRLSHSPGNNCSLAHVLVEEVDGSNHEQQRHSHSVHASDVNNVQDVGVLEVNHIFATAVQKFVLSHRSLSGHINVFTELAVPHSLESRHNEGSCKTSIRQEGVDQHRSHDLGAYVLVPWRVVVVEVSFVDEACNEMR